MRLGVVAISEDFGDKTEAYSYADASAAIGAANRVGLERIRHLDTQSLWLQQALRKRRLGLGKVLGTENPSDLMTKHVDSKLPGEHVHSMGCDFVRGRAELAPQVVQEIGDEIESEDTIDYVEDEFGWAHDHMNYRAVGHSRKPLRNTNRSVSIGGIVTSSSCR